MKKIIFSIAVASMLLQTGCATFFGEKGLTADQRDCQHHKPGIGEPKRKVRVAALVCDIIFGVGVFAPVTVGIDFLTGDIYKPCKVNIKYQCIVQKDTLPSQTLTGMVYDDKILNVSFEITSTSINFIINNKTEHSMKIDWNDVTIVQGGTTHRAVHTGVKLINKNESQPPSTIPAGATLDDGVVPSDNINWNEPSEYDAGGWQTRQLSIGNGIRLYLPIQYQNRTIDYNISFTKLTTIIK